MKNELYESLTKHIAEHGFKCIDGVVTHNSPVDALHAVISHIYGPDRYFVFLLDKSFLIRKYDDNLETRKSRRSVPII
jgi:hypothetical protein